MKLYALRSKKTGRYFKWVEYCSDDGWGKYEDDIDEIRYDDIPTFFGHYQIFETQQKGTPWDTLKNHTKDEVEVVEFSLTEK